MGITTPSGIPPHRHHTNASFCWHRDCELTPQRALPSSSVRIAAGPSGRRQVTQAGADHLKGYTHLLDFNEFLLTSTITPSERRIRVRTFSFMGPLSIRQWQALHWRNGRCRPGLLRGNGYAGGNVVLDRQVVALQREAHALLGELVRLGIGVCDHGPARHVGRRGNQVSSSWR